MAMILNSTLLTYRSAFKKSLSEILTHYYLLAGRFTDNKLVHCSDEGVPFLETRINCKLNYVLHANPVGNELNKLVPFELNGAPDHYPFGVQLNVFDCGRVAIGVCFSHKIADGLSCLIFINSWAAMTRRQADLVKTHFLSAKLFLSINNLLGYDPDLFSTKEKDDDIIYIQEVYRTSSESKKPISRVEALSTFIWNPFLAVMNHGDKDQSESDETKGLYALLQNVNLRSRMESTLPEYSFGNYYREVVVLLPVLSSNSTSIGSAQVMVRMVMDQIKKIDNDFIKKLRVNSDHEYLNALKENLSIYLKGGVVSFEFSSLCRFPFYDTESGGGIEACISLQKEDMAKFENDNELLSYVSSIGSK